MSILPDHEDKKSTSQAVQTIRAFFAIRLPDPVRADLEVLIDILRSRKRGDHVRWTREENLHVTLHFLGNVSPDIVPSLLHAVSKELEREQVFTSHLTILHLFPSERKPRVFAMGLGPDESFIRLAEAVKRGVSAIGLPSDARPFKGHLTLGRLRGRTFPSINKLSLDGNATFSVDDVILYQSELHPDGPVYSELGRVKLSVGDR